ncbi:MAG: permease [Acidobacteriia bacterium]|nr:permease [Terriglobia bacterium]
MNTLELAPNAAVAICDSHVEAQEAIERLCQAGFDAAKMSVAGGEEHSPGRLFGCYGEQGRVAHRGSSGAFWTGLWERLSGWALFAGSESGPILIAGPLAGWVAAALDNEPIFGGLSAFAAGLYSLGIPRDAVRTYEEAVRAGKFLVMFHGTASELAGVGDALRHMAARNHRRSG